MGAPIDECTFNTAINCYCFLNRVEFGFFILGITFTTFIKGQVLDYQVAEAEKLFKKAFSLENM